MNTIYTAPKSLGSMHLSLYVIKHEHEKWCRRFSYALCCVGNFEAKRIFWFFCQLFANYRFNVYLQVNLSVEYGILDIYFYISLNKKKPKEKAKWRTNWYPRQTLRVNLAQKECIFLWSFFGKLRFYWSNTKSTTSNCIKLIF